MARLPVDSVSLLVGAIWGLAAIFWIVLRRWEGTCVTEARRKELESEAEAVSPAIRAWRWMTVTITGAIPLLFAVDGFVDSIEILYAPELSFFAGPDLALQVVGIVLSAAGLAILIGVGRKLAVYVYRRAIDEREMMTTGAHRYVRHPFYIHFLVLPIGLCLLTLNYLALLVLAAYTTLWQPRTVVGWMRSEEDDLRRRYGDEAEAYLSRTGRVFPRLRRP
ncbi:MAG TPA: isoprenylcysteine carboxylmethyltransferase family protein [Actinomycetota bacterium]